MDSSLQFTICPSVCADSKSFQVAGGTFAKLSGNDQGTSLHGLTKVHLDQMKMGVVWCHY